MKIGKKKNKVIKKMVASKLVSPVAKVKKTKAEKQGPTKESLLVALLMDGKQHSMDEIVKKSGFAPASAKMYTSQDYLDRKNKPYKVVAGEIGGKPSYAYAIASKGKAKKK